MALPDTSKINFQIAIYGTAATGGAGVTPSINIFNYQRNSVVNLLSKAALNTIFQTAVIAPLAAAMNVRWTANNVGIRNIDDPTDSVTLFSAAQVGAITTDSLPSDDAVYFLFRTNLRGRNYRGAKHFGPASEVDTTQDLLTGAGLARWQAVGVALALSLVDANGNQWVPMVLSPSLSNLTSLPAALVVSNAVTQVLLDLNIGTMKKRRSRTIR